MYVRTVLTLRFSNAAHYLKDAKTLAHFLRLADSSERLTSVTGARTGARQR